MKRLRAGLLGLTGPGQELFEALRADPQTELAAVADRDRRLTATLAEAVGATAYDDYRVLIVESAIAGTAEGTGSGLDALFVALPVFEAQEYLRLAAGRGLPTFVVPPFARDADAAIELASLFARGNCPLVVARAWQFEPAHAGLAKLAELAGDVYWAQGQVVAAVDSAAEWASDSRRAGGGVLLHGGYEVVDALVTLMGVPDAVFAATGLAPPAGQARAHDTEDAASVVFRYSDDRTASITCRRAPGGGTWGLALSGIRATVSVGPRSMIVTNGAGDSISEAPVRTANRFGPPVNAFAVALAAGATELPSRVEEHIGTVATIGAAYLSVRTGQAESPPRFLELAAASRR